MLWFNARTTGSPLLFGYEAMWGKGHEIGFHAAPWGVAHTPARGFELREPLLPAIADVSVRDARSIARRQHRRASSGASRLRRIDGVLLAGSAVLILLYFAYWHDGFYLGPRFFVCLLPALALWSARFFPSGARAGDVGASYRSSS